MLIGRLGDDPEVNHLGNGVSVARFPLATSERYKDRNGERQERTEWHRVVVWRRLAEIAEQYLRKGSQIYVEGKIQTSSYEKNGEQRYSTEIVADTFQMLDNRPEGNDRYSGGNQGNSGMSEQGRNSGSSGMQASPEDDLPF